MKKIKKLEGGLAGTEALRWLAGWAKAGESVSPSTLALSKEHIRWENISAISACTDS